jgi:hypothetical protein
LFWRRLLGGGLIDLPRQWLPVIPDECDTTVRPAPVLPQN